MEKLWAGRFKSALDGAADDFNASIRVDARMYREDIEGSQAHVRMLGACGIVTEAEAERILRALGEIRAELDDGRLEIDPACEDIHSFVEKTLTARIGDTGKKLHTARSRNDQVAVDTRLYLRRMADEEKEALLRLVRTLVALAKAHTETILPGYTHLRARSPSASHSSFWRTRICSCAIWSGWPTAARASTAARWARRRWPARPTPSTAR